MRYPLQASTLAAIATIVALAACSSTTSPTPQPTPRPTATPTPAPTATPTPPPATLRSATFTGANGYNTLGGARIVNDGAGFKLEFLDDFRTDNSTALDVRLCVDSRCGAGNLHVATLMNTRGAQSYSLPSDGATFAHVVIWCPAVNLSFGSGQLR